MTPATARRTFLIASAAAFALWIGYLVFLAVSTRHPVVLSRPQFLVADLVVVAQVERADADRVKVVRVKRPQQDQLRDQEIHVTNLADCEGWAGADRYILPLVAQGPGEYRVAAVPRSPGYPGGQRPRIYPATPATERQLDVLPTPN